MPDPANTARQRDQRIDFVRGLAVIIIVIDHIHPNPLSRYTPWSWSYTTMAEVFVLISGYVCGIAYGRTLDHAGVMSCCRKTGRRWLQVYAAHILCSFAVLLSAWLLISLNLVNDVQDLIPFQELLSHPGRFISQVLLLQKKTTHFDILPLYLALLPLLPLLLVLEARSAKLLVVVSLATYLAGLAIRPDSTVWVWEFSPLSWQFLFAIGVILSRNPPVRPWLLSGGIVTFVPAIVILQVLFYFKVTGNANLPWSDRKLLEPVCLLSLVCFLRIVYPVRRVSNDALSKLWIRPILLCGRHTLICYCAGTVAASIASMLIHAVEMSTSAYVVFNVACIGGCAVVAWCAEQVKGRLRQRRAGLQAT